MVIKFCSTQTFKDDVVVAPSNTMVFACDMGSLSLHCFILGTHSVISWILVITVVAQYYYYNVTTVVGLTTFYLRPSPFITIYNKGNILQPASPPG